MYIGRFAPSPTGLLHLGSLLTAIASYCEARSHNGEWLVRIEDLDPLREVKGAHQKIIQCLSNCGFEFTTPKYQSSLKSQTLYMEKLQHLHDQKDIYYCSCSRKELNQLGDMEHECRSSYEKPQSNFAIKFKTPTKTVSFNDQIQGKREFNLTHKDDFVLKRKEGYYSYQLAVVVDDELQKISNIVRGIDLLDSTPLQILLAEKINAKLIKYSHLPILINSKGQKLSKQTFAKEVDVLNPLNDLIQAYSYLGQTQFNVKPNNIHEFWEHVFYHWDINKIPKSETIQV